MISVRKPDVFFVYLSLLRTCRVLVVENWHFRRKFWEVIHFSPEGPALNPVGTEADTIFWMPRRGYRS